MATEFYVLSDRRLTSFEEWQQAISAEGFPVQLSVVGDFQTTSGFLPAKLEGRSSGFECYHDDAGEIINDQDDVDFGHEWAFALGFRIAGDFAELRSAWMAATAYAQATSGIVYDPQEDRLYTHAEAVEATREIERNWPAMQAAVQAAVKKFASKS
jgi:hypothetical protein